MTKTKTRTKIRDGKRVFERRPLPAEPRGLAGLVGWVQPTATCKNDGGLHPPYKDARA